MPPKFLRVCVWMFVCLSASIAIAQPARGSAAATFEAAGEAAQQAGRFQEAFAAFVSAYQALPVPPSADDDRRLRERIIRTVQRLDAVPAIPSTASEHALKADQLLDAEAILGATAGASSQAAVIELRQAVRAAPWWAAPTVKLATTLQKLQRVDEALLNLNLYKLADPVGYLEMLDRAKTPVATAAAAPVAPRAVVRPVGPATIYVYWAKQQRGGGRKKVQCDAHNVAELAKNRFITLKAAAGTHEFTFDGNDVIAAVEGGREYYFRASLEGMTQFSQGPKLVQVPADNAKAEMRDHETKINDARRTFSADCVAAPAAPAGLGRPRK